MDYKTIFIVDPIKSDRMQLAKFLKQEFFTVMGFVNITDCFKRANLIHANLVIYVLRKGKTEVKHLINIKKKNRKLTYILFLTPEVSDIDLKELEEQGFSALYKASSQEKVREITLTLLAPDGIPARTVPPHPVPVTVDISLPQSVP